MVCAKDPLIDTFLKRRFLLYRPINTLLLPLPFQDGGCSERTAARVRNHSDYTPAGVLRKELLVKCTFNDGL